MTIPNEVIEMFPIGYAQEIRPISIGLIHATFFVRTDQGKYIIQRLHPALATEEIAQDFLHVTQFLHDSDFLAPQCVVARDSRALAEDKEGRKWRAQTYLSGKTYARATRPVLAREAGNIFASFHRVMDGFKMEFLSKRISHDTVFVYEAFQKMVSEFRSTTEMDEVKEDVAFVLRELPQSFLPNDLPIRAIHGDPKISNILFDAKGRAKALVDFDTCNRRSLLVELGDAFRSWCGGKEDSQKNRFRLDVFAAGWQGYKERTGSWMTWKEVCLIPQAIGLITLELAARFLTDYFVDAYFGWDSARYPSRRAHNLARARGQMALYKDIIKNRAAIERILDNTAPSFKMPVK